MKEWWVNLATREKQTVFLGGVLLTIFMLYEIIFSPLTGSVDNLRTKIQKNQSLLTWMQASDKHIQNLEKNPQIAAEKSSASLLSIVQDDINKNSISKYVTQLQQSENDTVDLRLQKVNFDNMIKWLAGICQTQHLTVTQLTATPAVAIGTVDAEIKLQAS
jgi:general secretion pathway protein M